MEPLFENHLTVDKKVLLEWYKKEFYRDNPFFIGIHIGLIAVYLLLTVLVLVNRWLLPTWLTASAVALFLVLAVLFGANLLMRYRLQVRALLKSEEGKRFPGHVGLVFYSDFAMTAGEKPGQDPAGQMLACVARASGLQVEFKDMMDQLNSLSGEDAGQMESLRPRLAQLQRELENLSAEAKVLAGRQHSYRELSAYAQTPNLHILHFGETAVLAARDGFTLGDDKAFEAFLAEKLTQAAAVAEDEKMKKDLTKSIQKYFPAQG